MIFSLPSWETPGISTHQSLQRRMDRATTSIRFHARLIWELLLHQGSFTTTPVSLPGQRGIPGAGFGQLPAALGTFQGSFVQRWTRWQLRVCSQVPTEAEIFIYSFSWKSGYGEKKNGEAAPRKSRELFPGSRLCQPQVPSKAPVIEPLECRGSERMLRQEPDFRISAGLSGVLSAPALPRCSTLICIILSMVGRSAPGLSPYLLGLGSTCSPREHCHIPPHPTGKPRATHSPDS